MPGVVTDPDSPESDRQEHRNPVDRQDADDPASAGVDAQDRLRVEVVTQSEPKARPTLIGDALPLTRRPVGLFVRGSICLMTLPQ